MKLTTELTLKIYIDGSPEQTRNVAQDQLILGRLPECDVYLPYSEISRRHCQFRRVAQGKWRVEDLGSTNGTVLNQVRVEKPTLIQHGDTIQIGNVTIKVTLTSQELSSSSKIDPPPREGHSAVKTILRNAEELRQRWIEGDQRKDPLSTDHITHARLQYIVEIAKGLNSAESIEAIFYQVESVIFQELRHIDRLALLIDVDGSGNPELYKAAVRKTQRKQNNHQHHQEQNDLYKGDWISQSICNKVLKEKVAIKTQNAQVDQRFSDEKSILLKGIGGALAVPLWNEKDVVGVLYADASMGFDKLDPTQDQDLSFFSTIANLVAASVQRWLLTRRLQEQERIRQRLERYHSPAVVQQLITFGAMEDALLTPMEADVSVLFADIVGFTALSEQLRPEELADLLNRFFEEMLKPLFAMGGTLDKFIGDCIMAFFGAPEPQSDHADRAVKVAKAMLERLEQLNEEHVLSHPLQLRIAINSGKAVVGDVGSSQRVDYTVLGGTVNLASRLEAVCRPGACVISEETYHRLENKQPFSPIGKSKFKGIDRTITVYCARW
ncbi:adenylate/guanylate cyclase with GAF sensor and FHA domain [Halothece sp. PCC 7418]|uniref:adenylate/guanylate cyclase domain-containing protein n=1 Tax=Halothece sp. (strain PCC 7418) TaxID=65093 RepID=UPI0002A06388|nr:adenylate/guanylate cyclase domain-containing protein [Halothece sp. PCC 7418]AFZ42401.1 adenylate/guanylate cyclase with GAF sensor and FHA domain [Halothece sp. PCC 7418]